MSVVADLLLWLVVLPPVLLFSIFTLEVIAGLLPRAPSVPAASALGTVVVVPAHNEAVSIVSTITAILAELPDNARLLVVADNCDDDTAGLARTLGVEVTERSDASKRGKGFALAHARDALAANPPDCVIVLDADCAPAPHAIARLRDAIAAWDVPVQATNLLRDDLGAPPLVQISNFAFLVKNLVRQRGAAGLGAAAVLGGTGMALPWTLFANAPLASDDLVEDLSLGIFAVDNGRSPRFLEAAKVASDAASKGSTLGQRSRWEHGFIATARKRALPLIATGIARLDWARLWLGLHLTVPPLALLVVIGFCASAAAAILGWLAADFMPLMILSGLMMVSALAVLIAWLGFGRKTLAGRTLLQIPLYVLWKLPVYARLIRNPEARWIRTNRGPD